MTYRNKLLLKRLLIILGIAGAVIAVVLLVGFIYLGRYVVYTEDGAHFSFHSQSPETVEDAYIPKPEQIDLVTGEPISVNEVIGDAAASIKDTDVRGVLVDYETLKNGSTLNQIELGAEGNNTLLLVMRDTDQKLLQTEPVKKLIDRAKAQGTWLVAVYACLSDSEYALAHGNQSLQIAGGALWVGDAGTYWLDPGNNAVITHLADQILTLSDMGFNEVVLTDFYFPYSDSLSYNYNGNTAEDIIKNAYNNLLDATMDYCKLGLLITDPENGHQAFDAADRIYVFYDDGGSVKDYAALHADQFLVFITSSHDTRFDDYGRIRTSGNFIIDEKDQGEAPSPEADEEETEYGEEYEDPYEEAYYEE